MMAFVINILCFTGVFYCVPLSNETLHELAAYLNLVPKRQESVEMEGDTDEISTALLVELLVRPHLTMSIVYVESTASQCPLFHHCPCNYSASINPIIH